jgi:hypothetical protein
MVGTAHPTTNTTITTKLLLWIFTPPNLPLERGGADPRAELLTIH